MGKAPLPHNKRNCFPPYPDHYLIIIITSFHRISLVSVDGLYAILVDSAGNQGGTQNKAGVESQPPTSKGTSGTSSDSQSTTRNAQGA